MASRVATDNGIRLNILDNMCICSYNCPVANFHPTHDGRAMCNPYIIANDDISARSRVASSIMASECILSSMSKRKRSDSFHPVIATQEDGAIRN